METRKYIEFTCTVCETRVAKTFTKQAYEKGVVIIRCDGCKNLHLIADHLGWTGHPVFDKLKTMEKVMAARGEKVLTSVSDAAL